MKICDCGNKIDPRNMGDDATNCEWCEYPEVPIYKIVDMEDEIYLYWVGGYNGGIQLHHARRQSPSITVCAPTKESADLIFEDYLANN